MEFLASSVIAWNRWRHSRQRKACLPTKNLKRSPARDSGAYCTLVEPQSGQRTNWLSGPLIHKQIAF